MRKNGSRLISLKQYRATDLFIIALILVIFDLLMHFGLALIPQAELFVFTLTVPIVMLVMMRWGWWSVFYAIGDAVLLLAINSQTAWESYLAYILGNSSMLLILIPWHFIGKQKVAGKWYLSASFVVLAWILSIIVNATVQACCGVNFGVAFLGLAGFGMSGMIALLIAVVLVLLLRRFDGVFEDQIHFLKRQEEERLERMRIDEYGETPIDIDEDTLSILKKRDDELE